MSTDTAELATATGHTAAISAATVTQHSKRAHDRLETSRSLSIRAYAAASNYAGRLNGGVRGLFNGSRSPRLKASPSDEFESFVLPHTIPGAFDKPPRCRLSHRRHLLHLAYMATVITLFAWPVSQPRSSCGSSAPCEQRSGAASSNMQLGSAASRSDQQTFRAGLPHFSFADRGCDAGYEESQHEHER